MKKLFLSGLMCILALVCMAFFGFGMKAYALDAEELANKLKNVPTKSVTIYNNTKDETLYPVLAGYVGDVDLWLQAWFGIPSAKAPDQVFCNSFPNPTEDNACTGGPSGEPPTLFRAPINFENGIAPGKSVSIDVPLCTQLKDITPDNLGTVSAQCIDWWNAGRMFIYDGKLAQINAYLYNVDESGNVVSPPPEVTPLDVAAVPTCAADNEDNCEDIPIVRYVGGFPTGSVPFQLAEYTFAAAEGPPPGGLLDPGAPFSFDEGKTNFNISSVDGVYMPVAMAAMLENDPVKDDQQYLGTTEQFSAFRQQLEEFSKDGNDWPYYWPSYFNPEDILAASPNRAMWDYNDWGIDDDERDEGYPLPSIPSAYVLIAESYKDPAPAPPVISSNTKNGDWMHPELGKEGEELVELWDTCTIFDKKSDTCDQIRLVRAFFLQAYEDCGNSGTPPKTEMLKQVYGWAQWPGCSLALAQTQGYNKAIETYCELQYNYLFPTPHSGNDDAFNAYNELIHKDLKSNAYGFSIDDKAAFKGVPSTNQGTSPGLIITVGGSKGLPDPNNQVPLPDRHNFLEYCH
jgi:hypothetical protein